MVMNSQGFCQFVWGTCELNLYESTEMTMCYKKNTCFFTNVIARKKRSVIGVKVALRINGTDLRQMPSQEGF